jgi:outer membrane lipoprotein-sorting protein
MTQTHQDFYTMKRIFTLLAACTLLVNFALAQTAEDVLRKYGEAMGITSAEASEFKTMSMDLSMSMMGMSMEGKMKIKQPNKMRYEMNMMGQTVLMVSDGTQGWLRQGGNVMSMPMEQLQEQQKMGGGDFVSQMKQQGYTFAYEGKEGGNYKLKATKTGEKATYMYFDETTHLLSKIEPEGGEGTILVSDYRKVASGVMFPHLMTMNLAQGEAKISYSNVSLNADIPDSEFSKPN